MEVFGECLLLTALLFIGAIHREYSNPHTTVWETTNTVVSAFNTTNNSPSAISWTNEEDAIGLAEEMMWFRKQETTSHLLVLTQKNKTSLTNNTGRQFTSHLDCLLERRISERILFQFGNKPSRSGDS